MKNVNIKTQELINVKTVLVFLSLGVTATFLPFFIHLQWLTGVIVNAVLVLSIFLVGIRAAIFLSLVPSLMALSGGLLPVFLSPMVPFIMISNVIFVVVIDFFYNSRNITYFRALFVASFFKFLFLFLSVNIIAGLLVKQELIAKVAQILSWPQFFTAFSGGMVAFIVLRSLKIFK